MTTPNREDLEKAAKISYGHCSCQPAHTIEDSGKCVFTKEITQALAEAREEGIKEGAKTQHRLVQLLLEALEFGNEPEGWNNRVESILSQLKKKGAQP